MKFKELEKLLKKSRLDIIFDQRLPLLLRTSTPT